MPDIFNMFSADSDSLVLTMLIFLAAATLAFSVMVAVRVRNSVKRRTTRIVDESTRSSKRALRHSSRKAAQSILDYTNKH
jgi:tight adherence protein C